MRRHQACPVIIRAFDTALVPECHEARYACFGRLVGYEATTAGASPSEPHGVRVIRKTNIARSGKSEVRAYWGLSVPPCGRNLIRDQMNLFDRLAPIDVVGGRAPADRCATLIRSVPKIDAISRWRI